MHRHAKLTLANGSISCAIWESTDPPTYVSLTEQTKPTSGSAWVSLCSLIPSLRNPLNCTTTPTLSSGERSAVRGTSFRSDRVTGVPRSSSRLTSLTDVRRGSGLRWAFKVDGDCRCRASGVTLPGAGFRRGGAGVGPLLYHRAMETLHLAIGLGSVQSSGGVSCPNLGEGCLESEGAGVGENTVDHHSFDGDPMPRQHHRRTTQKAAAHPARPGRRRPRRSGSSRPRQRGDSRSPGRVLVPPPHGQAGVNGRHSEERRKLSSGDSRASRQAVGPYPGAVVTSGSVAPAPRTAHGDVGGGGTTVLESSLAFVPVSPETLAGRWLGRRRWLRQRPPNASRRPVADARATTAHRR